MTLARLAPQPGELLWDVGAGCGSIGIEWMRAHPACRALAIEADEGRQGFIEHNRDALVFPACSWFAARRRQRCMGWSRPMPFSSAAASPAKGARPVLGQPAPGGRPGANAVTLQSELALAHFRQRHGGERPACIAHAQPLGAFDTWRQALPITLLEVQKPVDA